MNSFVNKEKIELVRGGPCKLEKTTWENDGSEEHKWEWYSNWEEDAPAPTPATWTHSVRYPPQTNFIVYGDGCEDDLNPNPQHVEEPGEWGNFVITSTNTANGEGSVSKLDTMVELHPGTGGFHNGRKFVLVRAEVRDVVEQRPLVAPEFGMWYASESDNASPALPSGADSRNYGHTLYNVAEGSGPADVTPAYSPCKFSVGIAGHLVVTLFRSYHPDLSPSLADLQSKFDAGTEALSTDNDGIGPEDHLHDSDPSLHDASGPTWLYFADDVPEYTEFKIVHVHPFPASYSYPEYKDIEHRVYLDELELAPFSDIKEVSTIILKWNANGDPISPPIVLNGEAKCGTSSMVLRVGCPTMTPVHEYGHCIELAHRNEIPINPCLMINTGQSASPIMAPKGNSGSRNMINRFERSRF
jgi:hypothetical protein